MKKKIIYIFLIFFILNNCGYKPLNSSKNLDVSITKINSSGEKKINKVIKNNLKGYLNLKNKSKIINLNINSQKKIVTISKDSKGNPLNLKMEIKVEIEYFMNDVLISKKEYKENFQYSNSDNKFDLNNYQRTIEKNLINKIIQSIILNLISL
jgi:hypothetical protein